MKNALYYCRLLLPILLLLLVSCSGEETPETTGVNTSELTDAERAIVSAINSAGHTIESDPILIPNAQLRILDQLSDKRIVGLGEATHGTKEFFQMKHRVFQYLVEEHGFKAFLFEMDMAEALIFNDWVQGRRDEDLSALMVDEMFFWTWRTEEVEDLLEWMREYNMGKRDEEMIHFYGVDTQTPRYDVRALQKILQDIGDDRADSFYNDMLPYRNHVTVYRDGATPAQIAAVIENVDFAVSLIEELEDDIGVQLGVHQSKWAVRLALHMKQVQQVTFDYTQNNRYHERDRYMADNTSWYFDLLGEGSKVVLWAHNGHLANDFQYAGIYGGSQGSYLKNTYGEDYQIIGFSMGKGAFTAVKENGPLGTNVIDSDPVKGSFNALFYAADLGNMILSLEEGSQELSSWYASEKSLLQLGSVYNGIPTGYYRTLRLSTHYDYIIHFDETDHSVLLN